MSIQCLANMGDLKSLVLINNLGIMGVSKHDGMGKICGIQAFLGINSIGRTGRDGLFLCCTSKKT